MSNAKNFLSRRLDSISSIENPLNRIEVTWEMMWGFECPEKLKSKFGKYEVDASRIPMPGAQFVEPAFFAKPKSRTYRGSKDILVAAILMLEMGRSVQLVGDTGTGKTTLAEEIAARFCIPFIRVQCGPEIDRSIFGGIGLKNGETQFFKGIIGQAIDLQGMIVLDEIHTIDPNRNGLELKQLLERKKIVLDQNSGGEGEFSLPAFTGPLISTSNTGGKKGANKAYKAGNVQDLAARDLWNFVQVGYMAIAEETGILIDEFVKLTGKDVTTIDVLLFNQFLKMVNEYRSHFSAGNVSSPITLRGGIDWINMLVACGDPDEALGLTVMGRLEKADIETLSMAFRSGFQREINLPEYLIHMIKTDDPLMS